MTKYEINDDSKDSLIERFNNLFRTGKVSVYIIVEDVEALNTPFITLIHRMRLGPSVLPIPAWLKQLDAKQVLQNWVKSDKSRVIKISHTNLQAMIDNRNYNAKCGNVFTYYLDLQDNKVEIEEILKRY